MSVNASSSISRLPWSSLLPGVRGSALVSTVVWASLSCACLIWNCVFITANFSKSPVVMHSLYVCSSTSGVYAPLSIKYPIVHNNLVLSRGSGIEPASVNFFSDMMVAFPSLRASPIVFGVGNSNVMCWLLYALSGYIAIVIYVF